MLIHVAAIGAALLSIGLAATWFALSEPIQWPPVLGCAMLLGTVLLIAAAGGALL